MKAEPAVSAHPSAHELVDVDGALQEVGQGHNLGAATPPPRLVVVVVSEVALQVHLGVQVVGAGPSRRRARLGLLRGGALLLLLLLEGLPTRTTDLCHPELGRCERSEPPAGPPLEAQPAPAPALLLVGVPGPLLLVLVLVLVVLVVLVQPQAARLQERGQVAGAGADGHPAGRAHVPAVFLWGHAHLHRRQLQQVHGGHGIRSFQLEWPGKVLC
mmetsp:Transcript_2843/g.4192  ORF Transcript_2843/g.4192 Transcript_2843/m.4192 type:complete len:215 (-) Transcript_2843:490-1134(-)